MAQGRTRVNGNGKQPAKGERRSYDYDLKLRAITHFAKHKDITSTVRTIFPGMDERERTLKIMVYKWVKQEDLIVKKASSSKTKHHMRHRTIGDGTVLKHQWENIIVKWIRSLRIEGIPVTARMLELKADEVAKEKGIGRDVFKASSTWRRLFMNRHRLAIRQKTRQGQKTPEDGAHTLEEFSAKVKQVMAAEGITCVYNADQTAICYEYLPKKTIDSKGVRTVWVKCGGLDKERMTAMLLGDSCGNKYPMFLVVKSSASKIAEVVVENLTKRHGFGRVLWEKIQPLQHTTGHMIFGNPSAWWNTKLSIQFLHFHFGARTNMEEKILLLWDDCSAHWTADVMECAKKLNVLLMKVPASYTWICQPADLSWNKPIKDSMRATWIEFLRAQFSVHKDDIHLKMLVPKRNQVIEWALKAWHDLSPVIVRTGFFRAKLLTRDAEAEAEAEHQEPASVGDAGDVVDAMARLGLLHHSGRAITEENDICERYEDLETNADADESDAGDSERDTEDRECD